MICSLEIIFLIFVFSSLNFELCSSTCARAEYETNGLCCLMCAPGTRVYRDCTESSSTTCVPCIGSTFLDAPNGLKVCFSCTVCDPGLGLRVKTACTQSSDTVCEPLEGYYCSEENRDSCIFALKHSKCSPGQYIKHIGTPFKDTECVGCAGGTFSNGSVQICLPHSNSCDPDPDTPLMIPEEASGVDDGLNAPQSSVTPGQSWRHSQNHVYVYSAVKTILHVGLTENQAQDDAD